MHILEIQDLRFGYTAEPVLQGVSLSIAAGQMVCITGENGSGKSTLLKLLLGELTGYSGEIKLFGKAQGHASNYAHIGYVPQASVMDKVAFPTTCRELVVLQLQRQFGWPHTPRKAQLCKADAMLERMGLKPYARTPFNELSGGLQQRVMIARALMSKPKLLVLDEPTAGVDVESKAQFLQLLTEIHERDGLTMLFVSHELDFVTRYIDFDAIHRIENGRIVHA
ncbi:ATP-binding cassette domain-containing protein [Collinsella sp. zg1085]|uniref:metal ABC transporter ATP-binding protein n=1 Tax=Collinsella sp. zg1085 TaxID=2844380 RepID=UPI001C0CEB77|nr:ATP-binding cassette domain-containing protein [Collinsella sp. zg1085]QWT17458.1 ATP-binding cassette domain-containing protein [Collinsella sp. zg1085]